MLKEITIQNTEVVIAALNEEVGVGLTIKEMADTLPTNHIVVIDGHSHDRTVEVAKDNGADILFQEGSGKGDAIMKAVEYLNPKSNYVVLTDADYTYPAKYVPEMIEILEQNDTVGMVCGNRFNGEVDGKALKTQFYIGNKMLAFAHSVLNGVELNDPLTGLRVVRAEILRDWRIKSRGFDIEVELNTEVQKQGYAIVEVPIGYRERVGEKKLKIKHGVTILRRMLTF
jgi:glycosyltransferase involved in cell wall biosynthesis